jgi:hypothetical protein
MAIIPLGTVGTAQYASATKSNVLAVTLTRAIPAGHSLAVFVALEAGGGVTSTIGGADARGNTYTAGPHVSDASVRQVLSLVAPVTNALSSGDAITVTASGTRGRWAIVVEEISGLVDSAIDASSTLTGTGSAMTTGATATLAQADELVFAAYSHGPSLTFTADTASGYAAGGTMVTDPLVSSQHKVSTAYQVVAATTAVNVSATETGSGAGAANWAALVVTLKGATTVDTAANAASGTGWVLTGASATIALGDGLNTTYLTSGDNPSGTNPLKIDFATPSAPPASGQTATFTLRLWSVGASSASAVVKVYTDTSTLQKTFTTQTLTSTPTDYAFTLSGADVTAITSADADWDTVYCTVAATATP